MARRNFSDETIVEAVQCALTMGKSSACVKYNISFSVLNFWCKKMGIQTPKKKKGRTSEEWAELALRVNNPTA